MALRNLTHLPLLLAGDPLETALPRSHAGSRVRSGHPDVKLIIVPSQATVATTSRLTN